MTENPSFSVVIAAYNAAATIVRSVSSCLEQTYPPREVIVVDDGSTDNTVALLEETFGTLVRIIREEVNQGPSAARNRGMDAATGDYIAFQDADDYWLPRKLMLVKTALQTQARFLFHRYSLQPETLPGSPGLAAYPLGKLLLRNVIATPAAVVINDGLLRFDERLRRMEDWDFFLRAAEKYGVFYLDASLTVLGRPVLSPGGLSSSRWSMRAGEMRVYLKWASKRPRYWPLLPAFLFWSLMKGALKAVRL